MSRELREIERKIREAAKKQEQLEKQHKEQIKAISSQSALDEKLKLEEELQKKGPQYNLFFIAVPAIIAAAFVVFLAWQICDTLSPKTSIWQRPQISDKDISDVKIFLSQCVDKVKRRKKLDDCIHPAAPQTWKNLITENFRKTQNGIWTVKNISADEQKIGTEPFYIATIAEEKEYFRVIVVKNDSQLYIYKCSQIFGENNESK